MPHSDTKHSAKDGHTSTQSEADAKGERLVFDDGGSRRHERDAPAQIAASPATKGPHGSTYTPPDGGLMSALGGLPVETGRKNSGPKHQGPSQLPTISSLAERLRHVCVWKAESRRKYSPKTCLLLES
jgi:hypothetical protein